MTVRLTRRAAMAGVVASATTFAVAPRMLSAGQPTLHDVRIQSFQFVPDVIRAKPGDVIRWTNDDLAPHTATADEFGWDTGDLAKGQSAEITVGVATETTYFCAYHPHMKGAIEIS